MEDEKPADSQETPPEEVEGAEEETPVETEEAEEKEVEQTEEEKEKAKQQEEINKKLGVPEKPKKKNDFQTRINELTKKQREAERLALSLQKQQEERDRDFDLLRKHNEDLMGLVKSSYEAPPSEPGVKPDSILKDLKASKQKFIDEKRKARAEGDYEKSDEFQDQINSTQDKINEVLEQISKGPKEEDIEKVVEKVSTKKNAKDAQESAKNSALQWIDKNKDWFAEEIPDADGKLVKNEKFDPVRHYAAIGMESELGKTWKGDAASLFEHIDKKLNEKFPAPTAPARAKVPALGGAGGVSSQAGKITLSSEELIVARKFFGDDPKGVERYAEQLKLMGGRK